MKNQLDLFASGASPSPSAKVIAFPYVRKVGKARHVAATLLRTPAGRRHFYWHQVVTGIQQSLSHAGISPAECERQISNFHYAVSLEMGRLMAACGQGGADERYS